MKNILLALLGFSCISAQASPVVKINRQQQSANLFEEPDVMATQLARVRPAAKGTAVMKRMIANSYVLNGEVMDSNRYYYSAARGSVNTNPASYFTYYSLTAHPAQLNVKYDSMISLDNYNGVLEHTLTGLLQYDASENVTRQSSMYNTSMFVSEGIYDNAGRLIQANMLDTFGGTPLTTKTIQYVKYDISGKRYLDSIVVIANGLTTTRREYAYDGKGNLSDYTVYYAVSGQLQLYFKTANTYDAQDRLLTVIKEGDFGNGFMPQSKDSFSYSGSNVEPSFHQTSSWNLNTQDWDGFEQLYYTFGSNGYYDGYTILRYSTDWDTIEHDVYVYDSNNLLIRSNGYSYIGGGQFSSTPYDQSNLYYEDYYPVSVIHSTRGDIKISISPNPTTGLLHISADGKIHSVKVVALSGSVVLQADINSRQGFVDVSQLAAGSYMIALTNAEGKVSGYEKFIKQ